MSSLAKKFLVLALIFQVGCAWAIAARAGEPKVIRITAKKFAYNPAEITLKKGVPVVLEFTSLDRLHGFKCPGLGIRSDIKPGEVARVPVTPQKTGDFPFHCDNFCGSGHGKMNGIIHVVE